MELQRVNPGVAGSIGVPVRVGRSNASEVAQIAAGAADAKARGDAAIAGAMNKLSGAVENYSQMRAAHSIREAKVEHKRVEADFAADMQQTSTQYGMALDALSPKTRQYFDLSDEEFLRMVSRDADNALSDVVQASIASPNEEGSNGIGFRNGRLFEGRMVATLSRGLKAKFLNDQIVARAKYHKDRAVGKIGENLARNAENGNYYLEDYKKIVNEQGSPYLTSEEKDVLANDFYEQGKAKAFSDCLKIQAQSIQGVFDDKFNEALSSGKSIVESMSIANAYAAEELGKGIKSDADIIGIDAKKIEESIQSGNLQLSMYSAKYAEDVGKASVENIRAVLSGEDGVAPMNCNMSLLKALYPQNAGVVSESDKTVFDEAVKTLNFGEGTGVYTLANVLREDISMLNIADEGDRRLLEQYLVAARMLPENVFADIQALARDKILMSGQEKPDMAEIKSLVASEFGVDKLSKLAGDDTRTANACIRACSGLPENQWGNIIRAVRETAAVENAAKNQQASVASILSSSYGNKYTTAQIFEKFYGFNVVLKQYEAGREAAAAAGN